MFFLILLPTIYFRFRRSLKHWQWGMLEDLFATGQAMTCLSFLPTEAWKPFVLCYFLYQMTDDVGWRSLYGRNRPSSWHVMFFSAITDWYRGSVTKEMWSEYILSTIVIVGYSVTLFWVEMEEGWKIANWPINIALLFCGLGQFKQAHQDTTLFHNPVVLTEIDFLRFLRRKLKRRKPIPPLSFPGEDYEMLSPHYPLLRRTRAFTAEKQFNIPIGKGEKPNIIFIFMESFRAKNIGCLGAKIPISPHFDALSRKGILFSRFHSNGIITSRGTISALFGIPPAHIPSYLHYYVKYPLIGLPAILKQAGYKTALIQGGDLKFEQSANFFRNHCFDSLVGKKEILASLPQALSNGWGLHDEFIAQYAADWLEQQSEPTFLSLFTMTNHHPWIAPGRPNKCLRRPSDYFETYLYSDQALGQLIHQLEQTGITKKSVIFIFGDHGQSLGEHEPYYLSHRTLYEEDIHIPLLILADGRIEKPLRIEEPCSQIDLLPTVLDVLQLPAVHHSLGTSLVRKVKRNIFFSEPFQNDWYGSIEGQWKYLETIGRQELYNIYKDPDERLNQSKLDREIANRMQQNSRKFFETLETLYEKRLFADPNLKS